MTDIKTFVVGPVMTNCYAVSGSACPGTCVLIDPGAGASGILSWMEENKLKPEAILLTHGHFDHIMAVSALLEHFPDTPVYAHEAEARLLADPKMNFTAEFGLEYTIPNPVLLKDGEELNLMGMGWKVLHTPGHTAGSCCYYLPEEGVLFSGDTLFCESCGRTDFPTGDDRAIVESIGGKLMLLPDEVKVYPGHEEATDIGHERKYNPCCILWNRQKNAGERK